MIVAALHEAGKSTRRRAALHFVPHGYDDKPDLHRGLAGIWCFEVAYCAAAWEPRRAYLMERRSTGITTYNLAKLDAKTKTTPKVSRPRD